MKDAADFDGRAIIDIGETKHRFSVLADNRDSGYSNNVTVIPRFAASATAEDIAQALQTVGCVIIENLAPVELIDQILAEMDPYIHATPYGSEDFTGRTTKRTGALLARSRASVDLVAHPLILDITQKILGPHADTFQLHLTQIINIGPGGQAQGLHRDQWCFNMFPFPADMDVEVSTIWALDDFTEENGATRVIPNSLNDPPTAIEDNHRTVGATMPKGSVVIYTGRTIHGGGANNSDRIRRGLNVDYILGWLRQEENQYLSCPPEIARTLPAHVQKLAGYSLGAYALGYQDDIRDPFAVLNGHEAGSSFGGLNTAIPIVNK